ncbi:MAG TPA: hypothetical protein VGO56_13230 [Pyrinomonadaceae bacterium]|jgi:hypothetical protein|nr:hypothetical protein [Pyrinomonadaceae bacterium]
MNRKFTLFCLLLIVAVTALSQQRSKEPTAAARPIAARYVVQGVYEEIYQGRTDKGSAEGKLVIKFEATRWLTMTTNEVGNAAFSDLANAPAPSVSGSASYQGRVKGPSQGASGDSYEAMSNLSGPLSGEDVALSVPEYTDTGTGFKIRVFLNPKLKGKCSVVEVRGGATGTSSGCVNGTYFFTPSTPLQLDDNEDATKTDDTANLANFGMELDIEPETLSPKGPAADSDVYAWRGAVTKGSKETGFEINLIQTKEVPNDDMRGRSTRRLTFSATIVPGIPKQ